MSRLESITIQIEDLKEEMDNLIQIVLEISPGIRSIQEANEHASEFVKEWEELNSRYRKLLDEREVLEKEHY